MEKEKVSDEELKAQKAFAPNLGRDDKKIPNVRVATERPNANARVGMKTTEDIPVDDSDAARAAHAARREQKNKEESARPKPELSKKK